MVVEDQRRNRCVARATSHVDPSVGAAKHSELEGSVELAEVVLSFSRVVTGEEKLISDGERRLYH